MVAVGRAWPCQRGCRPHGGWRRGVGGCHSRCAPRSQRDVHPQQAQASDCGLATLDAWAYTVRKYGSPRSSAYRAKEDTVSQCRNQHAEAHGVWDRATGCDRRRSRIVAKWSKLMALEPFVNRQPHRYGVD